VLVLGLAGSYVLYRTLAPATPIDQILPGYSQARMRQNSILMGTFVALVLNWMDQLREPAAQALTIAGVSVLVGLGCFRIAWWLDLPDRQ
jgi:hypothetical protein